MSSFEPVAPVAGTRRPFDAANWADQFRLSFLWFSGNALWEALLTVLLPLLVLQAVGESRKVVALSLIAMLGTLLASVVHPLAGWLSDGTRSRFGRRRPYVLGGGVLAVAATVWLGFTRGYTELIVAVLGLQFAYNVAIAAYQAYIPEVVPDAGRGKASGFQGLMSSLGALVGAIGAALLVRPASYHWMLLFLAVLLAAGVAVTVFGLPEGRMPPPRPEVRLGTRNYANLVWVMVTRALVMLGFYTLLTYLAYYLHDVLRLPHAIQDTSYIVAITILSASAVTLWCGRWSDRVGRRAIVSVAGVAMGVGSLAFLAVHGFWPVCAVGALFGAGYGAYISVDWALATDVLPDASGVARDMGVWGLAITVPQMLAPALAGGVFLLLPQQTVAYRAVFMLAGLYALVGSGLVWRIRGVR